MASKDDKNQPAHLRLRVSPDLLERIDAWRAVQSDEPSRAEATVRLLNAHFWPSLGKDVGQPPAD